MVVFPRVRVITAVSPTKPNKFLTRMPNASGWVQVLFVIVACLSYLMTSLKLEKPNRHEWVGGVPQAGRLSRHFRRSGLFVQAVPMPAIFG